MKAKPVIPREAAHRDVDEAVEHYLAEGSERAALGLLPAVQIRAYLATKQSEDGKNDKGPAKAPCHWR